jgi:hypothetical protein
MSTSEPSGQQPLHPNEPYSATERFEEVGSEIGLVGALTLRAVEVGTLVLIGLLVCPPLFHPRRGGCRPARRPDRPRQSHRGGPGDAVPDRSPRPWAWRGPRSAAAPARTCVPRAAGHRATPPSRRHPPEPPRSVTESPARTTFDLRLRGGRPLNPESSARPCTSAGNGDSRMCSTLNAASPAPRPLSIGHRGRERGLAAPGGPRDGRSCVHAGSSARHASGGMSVHEMGKQPTLGGTWKSSQSRRSLQLAYARGCGGRY